MDDVLVVVAGPRNVLLARGERRAERVGGRNEEAVIAKLLNWEFAAKQLANSGQRKAA